jgi:hypothetical protein
MNSRKLFGWWAVLVGTLLLAGCSLGAAEATPTATNAPPVVATETPTETPGRVVLLSSAESDAALAAEADSIIQAYASQNGLLYERREGLDPAQDGANLELIVVLAPDPGVAALAEGLPETRVITIGIEAQGANVQALQFAGQADAQAAFVAGYAAALATDEWRVGVLYGAESAELAEAFLAGVEFFCGSCAPVAPPYTEYPQAVQSSPESWQAGADALLVEAVRTIYLTPEMAIPEVQQYIANLGALLIGTGTPAPEVGGQWLATVGADPMAALREQLPQALAGAQPSGGGGGIGLSNVSEAYLSSARQADIQVVIDDLLAGYIALPGE